MITMIDYDNKVLKLVLVIIAFTPERTTVAV